MKKLLIAALSAYCVYTWANPANVESFDIEGLKLGMQKQETEELLKKICRDVSESAHKGDYGTFEYHEIYCILKEKEEASLK